MSSRSNRSRVKRGSVSDNPDDDGGPGSGAWAESAAAPAVAHHRHPGPHTTAQEEQYGEDDEFHAGEGGFEDFEVSPSLLRDTAGHDEPISYQEVPDGRAGLDSAVSGRQVPPGPPVARAHQRLGQQLMGHPGRVQRTGPSGTGENVQQNALQQQQSLVAMSAPNYPGQLRLQHTETTATPITRHHQPLQQLSGRHPQLRQIHPPYVLATPPADTVAPPPYPSQQQEQHHQQHHHHHQQFQYQHPHQQQQHLDTSPIGVAGDSTVSPPPQSGAALLCHPHDPRLLQPHQQQHLHHHHHQQQHAQSASYFPPDAADLHHPQQLEHQEAQLVTASASQRSFFPTPLDHPPDQTAVAPTGLAPPAGDDAIPAFHDPEQIQQFYQHLPDNWPLYQRPDGLWSPLMHPELSSILNAESYNDGTPTFRAPRSLPTQPASVAVDAGATRSLKRTQGQITDTVEWADEPAKKRTRGRPKLTNNGEAAADRRREQIRNAQRAYRNRKEEAITGLEKKVQELRNHKEQMSNAFLELHDFITSHGLLQLHPDMARQLQTTTKKVLSLAGAEDGDKPHGSAGAEGADSEANSASPASGSGKQPAISSSPGGSSSTPNKVLMAGLIVTHEPDPDFPPVPAAQHSRNWSQGGPPSSTSTSHQVSAAPCEVISQPTVHNASFPFGMSLETALETNPYSIDTSFMNPAYATPPDNMFPSPSLNLDSFLPPNLPPPSTFSSQERTFGRRLQRAALEQGLRLLSMADAPSHFTAGVFGFCLLFESRDMILKRLTDCLSINQQETLSNWRFPFLHLGGAGTFFQQSNEMDDSVLSQRVQGAVDDPGRAGFDFGGGATQNDTAAWSQSQRRYQQAMPKTAIGNRGLSEPHRVKVVPNSLYGMGPWNAAVETTRDLRVDRKLRIVVPGWEGDFFDCDEIEWYLQQRGIVIPPAADIIAAEIDEDAFMTEGRPGPKKAYDATIDNVIVDWLTRDYVKDGPGAAVAAHLATPSSSSTSHSHGTTPMGETELARAEAQFSAQQNTQPTPNPEGPPRIPPVARPGKRLITLNVDLLVHELTARSVCLGRTPGVRPKDVDAAFWNSVTLV